MNPKNNRVVVMAGFLQKYFIEPIYQGTGYNVVSTIVYGIFLGIGIIISWKIIEKLKIEINKNFFIGVLPFLVLASFLRTLVDANLLPKSFFLVSPGLFLTIFSFALATLVFGLIIQKKANISYYKVMLSIGLLLLVYPIFLFSKNVLTFEPLLYILISFMLSSGIVIAILQFLNISFLKNKWVYSIFAAHFLDASATYVGVEFYGYWEIHVFENFLIDQAGTALIIFPAKIIALVLVVFIIQRILGEKGKNFWYFAIFILGFSPGLRDTLTIMLLG